DLPVLGGRVDGCGDDAGGDTDGAADERQQDGLGEELRPDVRRRGAEGAAEPDLATAFEDADEHDVGDTNRADEERHGAEPEEEAVERALRLRTGGEGGGGLADLDLVGRLRVGRGTEHRLNCGGLARDRADVDRGGVAVEAEVALRRREPYEHGGVDLGREGGGVEDSGEVEPHSSQPDSLSGVEAVDAEPLRRRVSQHCDRLAGSSGVEVLAGRDAGADRARQIEARRLDGEGIGVHGRDERAPVDVRARRAGVLHLLHRSDARDHSRGRERKLCGLSEQRLSVLDREQVGAELVDLGEEPRLRRRGETEHRDDGGDADRDPECGQRRAHAPSTQPDARHPGEVGRSQPRRLGSVRAHRGRSMRANAVRLDVPATTAVTTKPPAMPPAVNVGATAMPSAFVATRTRRLRCVRCFFAFPCTARVWILKRPVAPPAGAVKTTTLPATGLPSLSVTVTASGTPKRVETTVAVPDAAPAATAYGAAA